MGRISSFIITVFLLFSNQALASGKVSSSLKTLPWADQSQYQECNQACLYQKANETISLEATYVLKKVQALHSLLRDGKDEEFRSEMKGFCFSGESEKTCLARYELIQIRNLHNDRKAIASNEKNAAALMSRTPERYGESVVAVTAIEQAKGKKPQVPYVQRIEELKREHDRLKQLGSYEYVKWEALVPKAPSLDDFVKFKEIPRDPNNPSAGKLLVLEKDPQGNVVYNEKAYKKAVAHYQQVYGTAQTDLEQLRADKPRNGDLKTYNSVQRYNRDKGAFATALEESAFKKARAILVDTANKALTDAKLAIQTTAKPTRKPATDEKNKATVPRMPGQNLSANVKNKGNTAPSRAEDVLPVAASTENREDFITMKWEPNELQNAIEDLPLPP